MMSRDQLVRVTRNGLLAFALVSLGVVWGKALMRRQLAPPAAPATMGAPVTNAARSVVVYYVHTTLRCVTCNAIERHAQATLREQFAADLAGGRVLWQVKDFQKDDAFARRYGIVSSCVLVVARDGEQEAGFKRLDEVWSLVDDPAKFEKYVSDAVRAWLPARTGA